MGSENKMGAIVTHQADRMAVWVRPQDNSPRLHRWWVYNWLQTFQRIMLQPSKYRMPRALTQLVFPQKIFLKM